MDSKYKEISILMGQNSGPPASLTVSTLEDYPNIVVQDNDKEYFSKVKQFAEGVGASSLHEELSYLSNYGQGDYLCFIIKDFSPYSFAFTMFRQQKEVYVRSFNGGLIYSGPGIPSNGSFPSFTVSLDEDAASGKRHMWSVHT